MSGPSFFRLNPPTRLRILASALLVLLLACTATPRLRSFTVDAPVLRTLDVAAGERIEQTLLRAASVFATTRAMNALISLIQNSEVDVAPAGIGLTIAAGEVLDPVNDLIERFSAVLLVAISSLGLQRVLLGIGSWLGVPMLLFPALCVALAGVWLPRLGRVDVRRLAVRLLVLTVFVRFAVPVAAVGSGVVFDRFLATTYAESTSSLEEYRRELAETESEVGLEDGLDGESGQVEEPGLLERLRRVGSVLDFKRRLSLMKRQFENYVDHIVNLIVVFLIETILLPVALLWLLLQGLRRFGNAGYPWASRPGGWGADASNGDSGARMAPGS